MKRKSVSQYTSQKISDFTKCGRNMPGAASAVGAVILSVPPVPASQCRTSSIETTKMPGNAAVCGHPARWTVTQISPAASVSARTRESGCASKCCTRSTTIKTALAIICAWAADAARMSVRNISPISTACTNSQR